MLVKPQHRRLAVIAAAVGAAVLLGNAWGWDAGVGRVLLALLFRL